MNPAGSRIIVEAFDGLTYSSHPFLGTTVTAAQDGSSTVTRADGKSYTYAAPPDFHPPATFYNQPLTPGCTITLAEGLEQGKLHIEPTQGPVTLIGAGMRKTILDGQGGVGSGHRLAWGKGIIHTMAPLEVHDIGFTGGGGGDGVSDGETSVYAEQFTGTLLLKRCAFDNCEDGIFSPPVNSAGVDYVVEDCVFGRNGPNGDHDELSHDTYVCAKTFTIRRCTFVGNSRGNTIKSRSKDVLIEDSFIGRSNGRWIDLPGATNLVTNRNIFVTLTDTSRNALGLNDEFDGNVNPGQSGSWVSTDDTFYFRRFEEAIWLRDPKIVPQLIRPKVFWIGQPGATPPTVVIQDNSWQHPFVFTEANRVAAAPDAPADPV